MSAIIGNLERFNRKERFHLLHMAIADDTWPSRDSFRLSGAFRARLGETLELAVPPDAFAAIDYHLDWIYAALYLALDEPDMDARIAQPQGGWLNSNQEDTDLLVAFDDAGDPGVCHLTLVEAKCETGWTNKQVQSKLDRLTLVYNEVRLQDHPEVQLHYVLTSPRYSEGLDPDWPMWLDWGRGDGRYHWIEMPLAEHWQAVRCDANGRQSRRGACWRLRKKPGMDPQ